MGALRERIARRALARQEAEEYEELNAQVAHDLQKLEHGHDFRSRLQIWKYQKRLALTLEGRIDPSLLGTICSTFTKQGKFVHLEQVYSDTDGKSRIFSRGVCASNAWTSDDRHTWQERRYRVSEFVDRSENGGWTVETIREVARQDRADNLLYEDFRAQSEILDFDRYCEERARRAAHVLLTDMYKGRELVAKHCEMDAVSMDEPAIAEALLHLYSRLCVAERRQRAENARKLAKRKGTTYEPVEETPLPLASAGDSLTGISKDERIAAALLVFPLLLSCCACHLAAAFGAPQKRFRALVKALRDGTLVLPDTGAEIIGREELAMP